MTNTEWAEIRENCDGWQHDVFVTDALGMSEPAWLPCEPANKVRGAYWRSWRGGPWHRGSAWVNLLCGPIGVIPQ